MNWPSHAQRGMYEATEYLAIAKKRLIGIVVGLFFFGISIGLIAGYFIWAPDPPEPEPDKKRPKKERVLA